MFVITENIMKRPVLGSETRLGRESGICKKLEVQRIRFAGGRGTY